MADFEKAAKAAAARIDSTCCGSTSPGSTRARRRPSRSITEICEEHLKGRYELEIIDIYQQPTLAKGEQIIAAPTLIKKLPLPLRRFIGDMADKERILVGLDLRPKKIELMSYGRRPKNPPTRSRNCQAADRGAAAPPGRGRGDAAGHPRGRGGRRRRLRQQGRAGLLAGRHRLDLPPDRRDDEGGGLHRHLRRHDPLLQRPVRRVRQAAAGDRSSATRCRSSSPRTTAPRRLPFWSPRSSSPSSSGWSSRLPTARPSRRTSRPTS